MTRKARDGTILVGNYIWLPKPDDTRAVRWAKKSRPKMSKHGIIVNSVSIGLDKMEAKCR